MSPKTSGLLKTATITSENKHRIIVAEDIHSRGGYSSMLALNKSTAEKLFVFISFHCTSWDGNLPHHHSLEVYYLLLPGNCHTVCQEGIVHERPIQVGNMLPEASGVACA